MSRFRTFVALSLVAMSCDSFDRGHAQQVDLSGSCDRRTLALICKDGLYGYDITVAGEEVAFFSDFPFSEHDRLEIEQRYSSYRFGVRNIWFPLDIDGIDEITISINHGRHQVHQIAKSVELDCEGPLIPYLVVIDYGSANLALRSWNGGDVDEQTEAYPMLSLTRPMPAFSSIPISWSESNRLVAAYLSEISPQVCGFLSEERRS